MSEKRGRTIYPHAASERLHVRLTPSQRHEIERVAQAHGTGISNVIRELIDERVEDRRPFPGSLRTEDD